MELSDSDWIMIGALGQWLAGIATFAAVWVALNSTMPKLYVSANLGKVIVGKNIDPNQYFITDLANTGQLPVTVVMQGISVYRFSNKFFSQIANFLLEDSVVFFVAPKPLNCPFPIELPPGSTANTILIADYLMQEFPENREKLYVESSFIIGSGKKFKSNIVLVERSKIPTFNKEETSFSFRIDS